MNKSRLFLFLLIAAGFLLSWLLFLAFPGFFGPANMQINDSFFHARTILFGPRPRSPYVVHIDIDDDTYQSLSSATSPTSLIADCIDTLTETGAGAVLLDVVVTPSRGQEAERLAQSIKKNGMVYCPVVLALPGEPQPDKASPPPEGLVWKPEAAREIPAGRVPTPHVSFRSSAEIEEAARGLGSITCAPDSDGKYRRVPLVIAVGGGGFVPFLSLELVTGYLGVKRESVRISPSWLTLTGAKFPDGRTKDIRIPISPQGNMIVDFAGPWTGSFPHYSAVLLEAARRDPALMEKLRDEMSGDIAIIADVSSIGKDFGPIPLENFYPLSGLHANVINSILKGQFLSDLSLPAELCLSTVLAALLWIFAMRWRGVSFVALAAACLAAYIALSFTAFIFLHVQSSVARSTLGVILAGAAVSAYGYLSQERQRAAFRARIERYFSPPILDKIMKNPVLLEGCEKKVLTILFSDIVRFSAWSANQAPETIRSMLNEYFSEMAAIVFSYGGTIDKYIGDGMLVFFGDPIEQPDHAERAVTCAVAMQKAVTGLRAQWEASEGIPIQVRIGINTGEVVVGNMGSASRLDYTVIGSHVNLAQRLEGKATQGQVLISRTTFEAVKSRVPAEPAGTIAAKGFEEPIEVFVVVPEKAGLGPQGLEPWTNGL